MQKIVFGSDMKIDEGGYNPNDNTDFANPNLHKTKVFNPARDRTIQKSTSYSGLNE